MLSPPFDFKAQAEGMNRLGTALEAFDGPGVAFVAQDSWAKATRIWSSGFCGRWPRPSVTSINPKNKNKAVEILVKYTRQPADDISKNYDAFYGADQIMSPDLDLTDKMFQPWLDLRNSSEKPARFIDRSYWKRALGR